MNITYKVECLTAVSHYLRALEQYLQIFKDDEFLVEVCLRCLEVLYIGKGGKMVALVTEPYNILRRE